MSFIGITDKGELIPIKRGQVLVGLGFLGIIVTNPDDISNDEYSIIGNRFNKPHSEQLQQEIIELLTKDKQVVNINGAEDAVRNLVIKRHPRVKAYLVLCDEETGQPLSGQIDLKVESSGGNPTKVTVTFEAWGAHGVRFEDEPRSE